MDHGGLAGIVRALLLRPVDNDSGHRRDENDGASSSTFYHVATTGLGYSESAIGVDVYRSAEVFGVILFGLDIGADHQC